MKLNPRLKVRVEVMREDYEARRIPSPKDTQQRKMEAWVNTGALMMIMGVNEAIIMGMNMEELILTSMTIEMANGTTEKLLWMVLVSISSWD